MKKKKKKRRVFRGNQGKKESWQVAVEPLTRLMRESERKMKKRRLEKRFDQSDVEKYSQIPVRTSRWGTHSTGGYTKKNSFQNKFQKDEGGCTRTRERERAMLLSRGCRIGPSCIFNSKI